jgi:hypothetical protein
MFKDAWRILLAMELCVLRSEYEILDEVEVDQHGFLDCKH